MTNGEKIKATFPHYDIEIDEHKGYVRVFYEDFYTTYPLRWWNAEYKEPVIRDNEVKDELNRVKDELEPTTKKDCNTCTHSNEINGSNCYECVKDMCNNYDPTTKNDLGDEHHKQNIQTYAYDFGVSEEQAETELRVTKKDLVVDAESRK